MEYMHDFPEIPYSFRLICNASEIRAYYRLRGGLGEPYMEYRGPVLLSADFLRYRIEHEGVVYEGYIEHRHAVNYVYSDNVYDAEE
jgi:hypothetical protein